jgi:hypothetical protein
MAKMLIDRDPFTGQSVWYEFNRGTLQATITHEQDVTPVLENNKFDLNDEDRTRIGMKRDWWHYARVPNTVILKWKQEKGVDFYNKDHRKRVFELLNDPEYRFLKTTHKHHAEK